MPPSSLIACRERLIFFVSNVVIKELSLSYSVTVLRQQLDIQKIQTASRCACLEGTRVAIRRQIIDILTSETGPNIVWLHGVAGCGKSTIATSIEDYLRSISQLGAFLKFERGKSDPNSVIREIAFNLAMYDSSIGSNILKHVKKDRAIASAILSRQFEELLFRPLQNIAKLRSERSGGQEAVIIVIDALDECGSPDDRKDLIRLLRDEFKRLPSFVRFLITSRPEPDIVNALSHQSDSVYETVVDYTSDTSHHDVFLFLLAEMPKIVDECPRIQLPVDWKWDEKMKALSKVAGGLFIWAATAIKFVSSSDNPFSTLKHLISNSRLSILDELYATVLRDSGISWSKESSRARFSAVLSVLLFGKAPLSDDDIDGLFSFLPDEPSDLILRRLRSVLSYTPGEPARLFHASFSDYLQSPDRANDPWFIDISNAKSQLAERCFVVMEVRLHFNICALETSFVLNEDVPDIEDRVKVGIPPYVEYACAYWSHHLVEAPTGPSLIDAVSKFAYGQLLFWFEAMSLTEKFRVNATRALSTAASWTVSSR